ncbi:CubicO group peptidase (beta-lactamase class C family) [Antricoccus suffuscus]|uniref:CubicO group peptidase (Beta-lactamase class C family) n=1 Tax=Antricoccus suffuscus TaxID=1629062 RepID=A0A2T0ZC23_9ACTN|nr:serine hydrolase domain-containing protein [Antricoccus suffuscus]PRZ33910.1 CubicO group peptidase (beta-lactamase class C family) [Antricoccus suffuscus]
MSPRGLSADRLGRLDQIMDGYIERGEIPGIVALVSRGDHTHVHACGTMTVGGTQPMRRDTIFRIASMTKPIAAAAAMILVEECVLRLDDPLDDVLPELAGRVVLRSLSADLDDTVPARRPITLRDLLTFRLGIGAVMAPPGSTPIGTAMDEAGLAPGGIPPQLPPDEWLVRLGRLPLAHQPGEGWMYHTGADVLGVLIARASGQPLDLFMQERIFEPLGMRDTAFHVPTEKLDRLPGAYTSETNGPGLVVLDDSVGGYWSTTPQFASGGGGLVATVDDYLAFCRMMLGGGRTGSTRILSRASVELMTTDHLTAEQRSANAVLLGGDRGWGLGVSVVTRRTGLAWSVGTFGWDGGLGTSAYSDPREDLVGILMTQRAMDSPKMPNVFTDFWTSAYQAVDD